MLRYLALIAAVALLPSVCLADKAVEKPVVAQTLAAFEPQAAAVRQGMQPEGAYSFMSDEDKKRVEKSLADMQTLLADHAGDRELSKQDQIALVNAQEQLNALLFQNDKNRLICERSAHTGSRIHVTTCETYGEITARQRRDQQTLSDLQRQSQTRKEGGS